MLNFFINPQHFQPSIHARMLTARLSDIGAVTDAAPVGAWGDWSPPDGNCALEYCVEDGVAVIGISGAIASAQIPCWFYYADITYENITAAVKAAVADPQVREIALRFASPGGTVIGCAEAAALLDQFNEIKPITAHCQQADSAAYWLASACGRIAIDPTGEAGSIGIMMTHFDMSKLLENFGVKVTLIYAGDRKVDGNPYEPLTPEAKSALQAEMNYLRAQFVGDVAKMRGLDAAAVDKTQAACYTGQLAVDVGLADEVSFFHQTLAVLAGVNLNPPTEEPDMAKKTATPKSPAADEAAKKKDPAYTEKADENTEEEDETDEDKKKKTDETDDDEGDEGDGEDAAAPKAPAAASTERERIDAILSAPEAEGREDLAKHFALKTDMSAKDAVKALAAAPKAAKKNPLAEGMKDRKNPVVGSGEASKEDGGGGENPVLATLSKVAPSMLKDRKTA